jgi:5,10-methylenetetrahydromethanopterin reductase
MLRSPDMRVGFGVTLLPNALDEFKSWCRTAEETGFDTIGVGDSQSLYREVFITSALCAQETNRVKFGPRVINPMTRHPSVAASGAATLAEMAPGRALLGIGSGDSSVHNAGVPPANLAEMRDYTTALSALLRDGAATYHGELAKLTWGPSDVPLYMAASGPKTLELAGEVADGVIIQTGLTPEIIEDSLNHVRRGAERAGRDFDAIDKTWFPWVSVAGNRGDAIHAIKHSIASGAKHLGRFTTAGKHIPSQFLDKIRAAKKRYRFDQHQQPDNDNARLIEELGLVDYLADRFAIVGTVEDCVAKIEAAAEAGANHFWMSVHFDDKERFMREWSETVMSRFRV